MDIDEVLCVRKVARQFTRHAMCNRRHPTSNSFETAGATGAMVIPVVGTVLTYADLSVVKYSTDVSVEDISVSE